MRRRLQDLQDTGVLTGFVAVPDPLAIGLHGLAATWAPSTPAERLLTLEGTITAGNSIGGGTLAGGFATDAQAWLDAATRVVGEPPATVTNVDRYRGPPLGPLELRTLRALVEHPRGPTDALAAASGLSAKTVRKLRARLLADKAVAIHLMVRTGASDAHVYHLHVTCSPAERARVLALLDEASVGTDPGPILCAFVRARSLAEQARTLAVIRQLGVAGVEVVHENEWTVATERLVAAVDVALARWDRARPAIRRSG